MEREELVKMREYQIGTASTEYYNKHPKADPISAFEDGVAWADEHPKNPWISVEDRLPEEGDDMLLANTEGEVLRIIGISRKNIDYIKNNIEFYACWMPTPTPKLKKGE